MMAMQLLPQRREIEEPFDVIPGTADGDGHADEYRNQWKYSPVGV